MSSITRLMSQSPPCVVAVAWQKFLFAKRHPPGSFLRGIRTSNKLQKKTENTIRKWSHFVALFDICWYFLTFVWNVSVN